MTPKVSVIMSTYNDAKYISQAIESVLLQTFTDFEFIITNDNSTDATTRILADYSAKDTRIRIIKNTVNKKLTANLNKMLEEVKSDYVARIDSDDTWNDTSKLETQVNFLRNNPDHALVGTWARAVDTLGRELFKISYPVTDQEIRNSLLRHNCFIHSGVLLSVKALDGDRYDNSNNYSQDYDLWLKLGTKGKMANIPQYMVDYRINPDGTSQKDYKIQTDHSYKLISKYRRAYPHYYLSKLLWFFRKYYPGWLRLVALRQKAQS